MVRRSGLRRRREAVEDGTAALTLRIGAPVGRWLQRPNVRLVLHLLLVAGGLYLVVSALIGPVNVIQLSVGVIVVLSNLTNLSLGLGAARRRRRDDQK